MDRKRQAPTFPEERKLLARCLAKDKKAWDAFVERYNPIITHAIVQTLNKYAFSPTDQVVPDLFNTVFLSIIEDNYKKLRQFQWKCKLSSWLHLIAARVTIDFLRKQRGDPSINGATDEEKSIRETTGNGNSLPDEVLEAQEEKQIFEEIKRSLSSRERLFVELHYGRELSAAKIASILNTTGNNVYQLKSRIREKMKKIAGKLL